ncbi:Ig-like domain-containing protein [Chitinophaga nivalis]|uniref:Ig-like domain-containing protein n=1 Tax=Chitinophaga nivalis TaxID=2991709 RepID=A0ABT3IV11_9BACT|nr:Ig-like domain-containing protein [Chitinophaga nivalis]MCW3462510.1 Ig-like domain-containing protein [Chitinophaga nivalis]MCW3487799.1 Ig-like domain-containing protein [Chitinophaga nivalis]
MKTYLRRYLTLSLLILTALAAKASPHRLTAAAKDTKPGTGRAGFNVALSTTASTIVANIPFDINIDFSEQINVVTAQAFTVTNGSVTRIKYIYGTRAIITVVPNGSGLFSIYVPANKITSPNGYGNISSNQLKMNITAAPYVSIVFLPAPRNYKLGERVDFTLRFTENVTVTGTPYVPVAVGALTRKAVYRSGSGTNDLIFSYTVAEDDLANELTLSNNLEMDGGAIKNAGGKDVALTFSYNIPSLQLRSGVNGVQPKATCSGATASNSRTATVTLTFNETISGLTTDDFQLDGVPGTVVESIGFTPPFGYVIVLKVPSPATGTLTFRLPANKVVNTAGNGNKASDPLLLTVNNTVLEVTGVEVPAARNYTTGDQIFFKVNFSDNVIVNQVGSAPYLPVTIGAKQVQVAYHTGSGGDNILFSYIIQPGDKDIDGIEVGPALLVAPAAIQHASGVQALPALHQVADTRQVQVNATQPQVDLSGPGYTIVKGPFTVLAVFSEDVTGFTASDVVLTNATAVITPESDVRNYFIEITPIDDGPVSVSIPADVAFNNGPNGNTASIQIDVVADLTPPVITQVDIPAAGKYGTTNTLDFTLHFSEDVVLRQQGGTPYLNIGIGGKTVAANLTAYDNNTMTFSYPIQDGDVDMDGIALENNLILGGARIQDNGGNKADLKLPVVDPAGILINTVRPSVVLSTTAPALINNPFTVLADFSEAVTGLTAASFLLTNCYVDNVTTSDNIHYVVEVSGQTNGAVQISLPQDAAVNSFSTGNTASNTLSFTADYRDPKPVTLDLPLSKTYGAGSTLLFKLHFNEPVVVASSGTPYLAINLEGKTVPALYTGGSGTNALTFTYTTQYGDQALSGISLGTGFSFGGGLVQDLAGNIAVTKLPVNNPGGIVINTIRPTVTLSAVWPLILKDPFTIKAVFSEVVTGFTAADLSLVNATADQLQTIDNITYTMVVTPSASGAVSIAVPADAAVNGLLNGNSASNQLSGMADITPPQITSVDVPANGYHHAGHTLSFTVHYSEVVEVNTLNGVPYLAVNMQGTTVRAMYTSGFGTNALTFSYTIQPGDMDMDGIAPDTQLSLNGAVINDVAGNLAPSALNNVPATTGVFVNTEHPTVTLSASAASPVNTAFTVTAVFSEVVTGLSSSDFTVSNATLSNLQTTDYITYTIQVSPAGDGAINIFLPADVAVNIGNNGNTAANSLHLFADVTAPVVGQVFVPVSGYYNATGVLDFIVWFSEQVTVNTGGGTPSLDITIGGAVVKALYKSGAGTNSLSFSYAVQPGDMDMDGIVLAAQLTLNGGAIVDVAGNAAILTLNSVGNTNNVFVNTVHPAVTLSTTAVSPVNRVFTVSAVFSEVVTGLSLSDFTALNASLSNLQTTDDITYTLEVTPVASGLINIFLPADVAENIGHNGNTAANTLQLAADVTAPVVTAVHVPANGYYNVTRPLNFSVEFSEPVTVSGTPSFEITVGNVVVNALYNGGSGTNSLSFSYAVQPGDMDLNGIELSALLSLNGGSIVDVAGNAALLTLNNAGNTSGIFVSTVHPTVTLSASPASPASSFIMNVTFSEDIKGISLSDFTVSNATLSDLQTKDNIKYTVQVTPAADGLVSISLPANVVENTGGNGNAASNQLQLTADITAPVVTQVGVPADGYYNAAKALNFSVQFSEPVTVNIGGGSRPYLDVTIGKSVVKAFYNSGSGTNSLSFSYTIQPGDMDLDGIALSAMLSLNGGRIVDVVGNVPVLTLNNVGNTNNIFVNTGSPVVTLSTTAVSPVNTAFTVSAVFSELVTGLSAGDFNASNATLSNLQTTDGITYTLLVTPAGDGVVSISLPAGAAENTGGNGNTSSNQLQLNVDVTAPVVTQVQVPANGYYNEAKVLTFSVQYSEPVIVDTGGGTPSLDIIIGASSVKALYSGGGTNSLSFSYTVQPGDMDIDGIALPAALSLNGGRIVDLAGNAAVRTLNNVGSTNGVFVNTAHPTVTLSTTAASPVNVAFTVSAVFSETVTGLSANDFIASNATLGNPQTADNITYTLLVTPSGDGLVSISLPADVVVNVAGNGNTAANTLQLTADVTAPVITQVQVPANGYYNEAKVLTFSVQYSEPVIVHTGGGTPSLEIIIGASAVKALYTSGTGTNNLSFSYTVQPGDMDMNGIALATQLSLNGGTIVDMAGNAAGLTLNNVGSTNGILVNTAHPTVTLSTTAVSPVKTAFDINVIFSEAVTGLSLTDFTVGNATLSNLHPIDNITYTVMVTPISDGPVSVSLPADVVVNIGNNGNTASNSLQLTADVTVPVVTQVQVPANGYYNAGKVLTFSVQYSEPVIVQTGGGTPSLAITMGGSVVKALYTGGSGTHDLSFSYTVQPGDLDMDGIALATQLTLNGGTIADMTGNVALLTLNNVGNTNGIFVNAVHPTVALSTAAVSPVKGAFTVNVVFSEAVTGLSVGDFIVSTNTTLSNLQTTDRIIYTLQVTPGADGLINLSLPANAAENIGSNGNTASNALKLTVDMTTPVVTRVQVPANGYYNVAKVLTFAVQYNKPVIVYTGGGTPSLAITMGRSVVKALYSSGSGTNSLLFSYTVQPGDLDMDGIVLGTQLSLNGGAISDAAGNVAGLTLNNAGNTNNIFVNTVHPAVTLSTTAVSPVNAPFTVSIVFSEAITGLSLTDFTVSNATLSNLQTTDRIIYTVQVTPATDGLVSISLPADVVENIGSNGNTASNVLKLTADMTAPVVTQVQVPANGYYNAGKVLTFSVQYSEPVIVHTGGGTPSLDIVIGSAVVKAVYSSGSGTNNLLFSYTVQPGDIDMNGIALGALNGGTIVDIAGNAASRTLNNVGNTSGVFVNTAHPAVTLTTTAVSPVNKTFAVNATFSEVVTGLSFNDFVVSNATLSKLQTTDNITYTVLVTPTADGLVNVSLPADVAVNIGGNGNTAANTLQLTADVTAPVVTQVQVPANGYYNVGKVLNFSVQYSEPVTVHMGGGVPSLNINLGSAVVKAVYKSGSGTNSLSFSYTVQPGDMDIDGVVLGTQLSLNGSTLVDIAGNAASLTLNNVGNTSGVFVNTAHPTVTLATTAVSPVNKTFAVNATFSEVVTGLSFNDFVVSNATLSNLQTTDGITYTVQVTPNTNGLVNISLPADVAVNMGGNGNTAANSLQLTADITAPVITQVQVPANGYYNAAKVLTFSVQYSEPVMVHTVGGTPSLNINLGSAVVKAVYSSGSGTNNLLFSYTVQPGDLDMDGIVLVPQLLLNGGSIVDVAGNVAILTLNNTGNTNNIFVNTVHPAVTLSTTAVSPVNKAFIVNVVFSEGVTGLSLNDFVVSNATLSNLQTTTGNTTYTLLVTPAADGSVSVGLPADAAVNIGLNGNLISNVLVTRADLTAPVITAGQVFSVKGRSPAGQVVGTVAAVETTGILQQWKITQDGAGGALAIDPATGAITVKDVTMLNSRMNTTVTLQVSVSDGLNVSVPVTVSIKVLYVALPPTDLLLDNYSIKENSPVGTLVGNLSAVTADPASTAFTYQLVAGAGSDDNHLFTVTANQLTTAAILNTAKLTYAIRVRAAEPTGLFVEKMFTINLLLVNKAPVMDPVKDQAICYTDDMQQITVTGVSPVEDGQTLSFAVIADRPYFNKLTISADGKISYQLKPDVSGVARITVIVKDNGGTAHGGVDSLRRTFALTVHSTPVVSITSDNGTTVSRGDVVRLTASGGKTYSWAPVAGIISGEQQAVLTVRAQQTNVYQVTATSAVGCAAKGEITIQVTDDFKIDATNILTPNGDGKNDRWVVRNLDSYPDNEVTIYDRSGRTVFHRRNYSNDWDGTLNGHPLAEGTYYYILHITGSNKTAKGFITIIRDK